MTFCNSGVGGRVTSESEQHLTTTCNLRKTVLPLKRVWCRLWVTRAAASSGNKLKTELLTGVWVGLLLSIGSRVDWWIPWSRCPQSPFPTTVEERRIHPHQLSSLATCELLLLCPIQSSIHFNNNNIHPPPIQTQLNPLQPSLSSIHPSIHPSTHPSCIPSTSASHPPQMSLAAATNGDEPRRGTRVRKQFQPYDPTAGTLCIF